MEVNRQLFNVTLSEEGGAPVAVSTRSAGPAGPARPSKPGAKAGGAAKPSDGTVTSPMMSRVVKVCVEVGAEVKAGQPLVVVEAMKMESELLSPKDGKVGAVNCAVGDTVEQGKVLIKID
ncbi:Glutaconyl-CoA decarboxylase subunit gamma [compost metagenome]